MDSDFDEKVRRRMYLIERAFEHWCERQKSRGSEGFEVSRPILRVAVVSYFHDIERMKKFHRIEHADEIKQAAYTIKWITQLRPFGFQRAEDEVSDMHLVVNEHMAWRVALCFLGVIPEEVPPRLFQLMLYSARYRIVDENALLMFCEALCSCADSMRELNKCQEQLKHWKTRTAASS